MWTYILDDQNEIVSETQAAPAPGLTYVQRPGRFNQRKQYWDSESSQFINRPMLHLSVLVDGQTVEIAEEGDEITFEAQARDQNSNEILAGYNETVIVRIFPEGAPSLNLRLAFSNGVASKTLTLASSTYLVSAKESLDSQEMFLPLDVALVVSL